MNWRKCGLTVAGIAGLVTAVAPIAGAAPAQAEPIEYVALGDSFVSGPLIPIQESLSCTRSTNNYPHRLAASLDVAELRDVSCSGAVTDNLYEAQSGNPPQIEALDADTDLVTLSLGGNDVGFIDIILNCVTLVPAGTPCQDTYVVDGVDTLAATIDAYAPELDAALQDVRAAAPEAEVLVVGYPALLPESGWGCWPTMAFAPDDVPYLRDSEKHLNAVLAEQAAANGMTYVDLYTPSIGHDACASPLTRYVEPLVPLALAAPVHPNARGMRAAAGTIERELLGSENRA